jgi:hypothetical protein
MRSELFNFGFFEAQRKLFADLGSALRGGSGVVRKF